MIEIYRCQPLKIIFVWFLFYDSLEISNPCFYRFLQYFYQSP